MREYECGSYAAVSREGIDHQWEHGEYEESEFVKGHGDLKRSDGRF
jgi:hypothetical protein